MAKFRKKPMIVDAVRVTEETTVQTLNGPAVAKEGDWIITGPTGESWPCHRQVFDEHYELVEKEDDGE